MPPTSADMTASTRRPRNVSRTSRTRVSSGAEGQLLDCGHRRADDEREDNSRVVVELLGVGEHRPAVDTRRLERRKRAEVRVAAAAGAKHGRAVGDVADVLSESARTPT